MGKGIHWAGLEELIVKIDRLDAKAEQLANAVIKNKTEKLMAKAKEYAPVDTGFLKTNIKTSYPERLQGVVHAEAGYSGYQEYGTRFQSGKSFIRPALEDIAPEFKKDMKDIVKGGFK